MIEWKKINGFSNYSVSNIGGIMNHKTNRALRLATNKCGYLDVALRENKKKDYVQFIGSLR